MPSFPSVRTSHVPYMPAHDSTIVAAVVFFKEAIKGMRTALIKAQVRRKHDQMTVGHNYDIFKDFKIGFQHL